MPLASSALVAAGGGTIWGMVYSKWGAGEILWPPLCWMWCIQIGGG